MTEQNKRGEQDTQRMPSAPAVSRLDIDITARLKVARATDNAIASSRLSGLDPSAEDVATLRRIERGEITTEQAIAEALSQQPPA